MNGVDLLHTVRMRWPEVTRVLLTGRADLGGASRAVNDGHVARLFAKPWDPAQLKQEIVGLVAHRHLRRDDVTADFSYEFTPEQLLLTDELQTALEQDELRVVYQPLLCLPTRRMVGVERVQPRYV